MIRRPPRSTQSRSSAASDVYKRQPTIESLLGLHKGATQNSNSYFGGNVGIGTTSPSQKLEVNGNIVASAYYYTCLLYTSPSPRDRTRSRMPSSA